MPDNFEVALTRCYFCGDGNEIIMNTRFTPSAAAHVKTAHNKVLNMHPCPKCEGLMKQGIILITVDEAKSAKDWAKEEIPNPYRTGGFFVLKEEAVERLFDNPTAVAFAKKHRWLFIAHEVAEHLGMFRVAEKAEVKESGKDE